MVIIRSRAPVRLSFGGGGTDVSPYLEEKGGCVVSTTINKYAWGTLQLRKDRRVVLHSADMGVMKEFDKRDSIEYGDKLDLIKAAVKAMGPNKGMNVFLRGDFPAQSGLGGSGACMISLLGLFNHLKAEKKLNDYELAELAYQTEINELKNKTGKQDQYAAVFGGFNYMSFKGDCVQVSPLRIKRDHILELEKNLILIYLGKRKVSGGEIISGQTKSFRDKESKTVDALDNIKRAAEEMMYALTRGDLNHFGELLDQSWQNKKKLSPHISNRYIDSLYTAAKRQGALGGKITGAGAGGFMVLYCKPNTEHLVAKALQRKGVESVPFTFDTKGLQTWEVG